MTRKVRPCLWFEAIPTAAAVGSRISTASRGRSFPPGLPELINGPDKAGAKRAMEAMLTPRLKRPIAVPEQKRNETIAHLSGVSRLGCPRRQASLVVPRRAGGV
jgi:hypothetical protein